MVPEVAEGDWSGCLGLEEQADKDVASTYVLCPCFAPGSCFGHVEEI